MHLEFYFMRGVHLAHKPAYCLQTHFIYKALDTDRIYRKQEYSSIFPFIYCIDKWNTIGQI